MKVTERIREHYEVREMEGGLGRAYKWRPEQVVLQCDCGKRSIHKRADLLGASVSSCECGEDDMGRVREELVLQLIDEEGREVNRYPWRYWHPPKDAGVPF